MKKSDFKGLSQVFKFTLVQAVKQKSYIITLVIMLIFAIGYFPVMNLINMDKNPHKNADAEDDAVVSEDVDSETGIDVIYCLNEAGIVDLDLEKITEKFPEYKGIKFENVTEDADTVCDNILKSEDAAVFVDVKLDMTAGGFKFTTYYDPAKEISEDEAVTLSDDISEWFEEYKIDSLGVDESLLENMKKDVYAYTTDYADFTDSTEVKVISERDYGVVYALLMIFYMVIIMCASLVANKVVEEKANRIVEYLMTTVRPMALMLGKIFAMLIAGVGEVVLVVGAALISNNVSGKLIPTAASNPLSNYLSFDGIKGLSIPAFATCVCIMVIGVIMYGLIAGLFGASVSKMEDVQQGLRTFTLIILVAFFASMIAANLMWSMGINGFVKFTMFFPLTSVMILPGVILIGEATVLEIAISILIMIVTSLVVFWFVSLIYESVIVMNGSPISLKNMIKIAKGHSNSGKGARD